MLLVLQQNPLSLHDILPILSTTSCRAVGRPKAPPPAKGVSGIKRTKREASPDYVPQPSKKKRDRAYSPTRLSVPREAQVSAPAAQQASSNSDIPDEVSCS